MSSIGKNIKDVLGGLPEGVSLVAVSKFHDAESIMEAYRAGQRDFGESYVKELLSKAAELPKDISWHFIGHLQTNKVRLIAPFVSLIHSVDSERLAHEIQRQAFKSGRIIDVLLELHIAGESAKSGFTLEECSAFLGGFRREEYPNMRVCGLMTMATNTDDEAQIEREFRLAAEYFDSVKERFFAEDHCFCIRSWGMSGDYNIAVRQRSSLVRIGTRIFGERK